jgi:putative hemolysin
MDNLEGVLIRSLINALDCSYRPSTGCKHPDSATEHNLQPYPANDAASDEDLQAAAEAKAQLYCRVPGYVMISLTQVGCLYSFACNLPASGDL